MKTKDILIALLIILIVISQVGVLNFIKPTYATTEKVTRAEYNQYFYKQLTKEQKGIYDGMYDMYKNGIFKTGKEDYNLSSHGYVSDEQIKKTLNGNNELLNTYGAARDAFVMDYPDVFYVDFSNLTIKIRKDKNGKNCAYLGTGREKTYYLDGFNSEDDVNKAIKKYEEKIDEIVNKAQNVKATSNEKIKEEQVRYVHNYIATNMIYRYEDEVTQGNARTAYDCLVIGEGVCEAYTRGFKTIMDRLNIPCVCVEGVYKVNDAITESHIWNNVQINGKWYGVDVTMDDPTGKSVKAKHSGKETADYLLIGETDLAVRHIPSGILAGSDHEFTYPKLELDRLIEKVVHKNEDFHVSVEDEIHIEAGELAGTGTMKVSYKNKNYKQNAKDGKYILAKFAQYDYVEDKWAYCDWCYLTPELYPILEEPEKADPEIGYYVKLPMPHIKKAQFAVTDIAPDTSTEGVKNGGLFYKGDPSLLTEKTEMIENVWGGDYVAPPYPKTVTPNTNGKLYIGRTYDVKIVYDDDLVQKGEEKFEIGMTSASNDRIEGTGTGVENSKIEDVKFDGSRTITFKFTPSEMYADDCCFYNIHVKGLVGKKSKKAPVDVSYFAGYECSAYAYVSQGYDWNVYGKPQLLDTSDIDTDGWQATDFETGEKETVDISKKITHRLTLVTTKPSDAQSKQMNDILSEELEKPDTELSDAQIMDTETYNIKLTLCKKQIIKTGQGVRVSVGFPDGYGPDDEGVTFKAYHYIVNPETNVITGVEEIDCVVTRLGLILTIDSFSPFTIAAVKGKRNIVEIPKEKLDFTLPKTNFVKGEKAEIATIDTENNLAEKAKIEFSSVNEDVATVNEKGEITTVGIGETTIAIYVDGTLSKEFNIHVYGDESEIPSESNDTENGGTAQNSENQNPPQDQDDPQDNNSILPDTGDIAIGSFTIMMIVSLIGIIHILNKKNKISKNHGKHC